VIEVLQFILGGFWRFIGTAILLSITGGVLVGLIKGLIPNIIINNNYNKIPESDENDISS